jgi:purine-cytosine permease-like protein
MPLLVAVIPLLGAGFLHNPLLELFLMGTAVFIAGAILIKDYLTIHRSFAPIGLLLAGVAAKLLGIFIFEHQYEPVVVTSGAAFILLAYIANWRLRASHRTHCKS